jgi:ABC-type glutathione transport system ATPase component
MRLLPKEKVVFTSGRFTLDHSLLPETQKEQEIEPTDSLLEKLRGRSIAMIFQEPMTSLNPVMSCGKQVEEILIKHLRIPREKARLRTLSLFEEVKLPRAESMLDAYPHQLSGGQRQRVMIAMGIACEPKLLIADEPTTALDVTVQHEILQLLKQLQQKRGMGMIFITHDLGVVEEIADDILVMKKGQIVEYGKAIDVLQRPQHEYTRGLLQCRPRAEAKNLRLLTVRDFEENTHPAAVIRQQKPFSENIFLNGAILGMSRAEIRSKFDEIVDFAGVERFLDTPVKRYSSGMYVRLAFAVAAHLESEVLIVDEVLTVGDVKFQKKCLGRIEDVTRTGRTVLLVSHQMEVIKRLATTGLLLNKGSLAMQGRVDEVVKRYLSDADTNQTLKVVPGRAGFQEVVIDQQRLNEGDLEVRNGGHALGRIAGAVAQE